MRNLRLKCLSDAASKVGAAVSDPSVSALKDSARKDFDHVLLTRNQVAAGA